MEEQKKPSFLKTMFNGAKGYVKGLLAGGAVGAISGAAIGAIIALVTGNIASVGEVVLEGIKFGTLALGSIGAMAGTMTEVVRTREAAQVSGQEVANVAKIALAQGIGIGHQIAQAEAQEAAQAGTKFRDKIAQERATRGTAQQQVH